ncbi:MAG: hypothetical protein VW984_09170, partial [Halieaceae bacterium]
MPATHHTARSPLGALLLAGFIALSALAAPAVSEEANNSADAERNEDVLTSEVVPPEENFIERAARAFTESDLV